MSLQQYADDCAWTAWQIWKQHLANPDRDKGKVYYYREDGSCMNPDKAERKKRR
jgi:hypothetical protein